MASNGGGREPRSSQAPPHRKREKKKRPIANGRDTTDFGLGQELDCDSSRSDATLGAAAASDVIGDEQYLYDDGLVEIYDGSRGMRDVTAATDSCDVTHAAQGDARDSDSDDVSVDDLSIVRSSHVAHDHVYLAPERLQPLTDQDILNLVPTRRDVNPMFASASRQCQAKGCRGMASENYVFYCHKHFPKLVRSGYIRLPHSSTHKLLIDTSIKPNAVLKESKPVPREARSRSGRPTRRPESQPGSIQHACAEARGGARPKTFKCVYCKNPVAKRDTLCDECERCLIKAKDDDGEPAPTYKCVYCPNEVTKCNTLCAVCQRCLEMDDDDVSFDNTINMDQQDYIQHWIDTGGDCASEQLEEPEQSGMQCTEEHDEMPSMAIEHSLDLSIFAPSSATQCHTPGCPNWGSRQRRGYCNECHRG